ncbi:uncharacterized [Tachysurus ichikawai]
MLRVLVSRVIETSRLFIASSPVSGLNVCQLARSISAGGSESRGHGGATERCKSWTEHAASENKRRGQAKTGSCTKLKEQPESVGADPGGDRMVYLQ